MSYHPVVNEIKALLEAHGVSYEFFEHAPVRTSEQAAAVRPGYTLKQGAKALLARVKQTGAGKRFVMFVLPADRKLDTAKLRANLGFKDVRFAREAEVEALTGGVRPGGVPPFGHPFRLELFVDPALFAQERIVFNCGDRRASIALNSADYRRVAGPTVVELSEL